MSKYKIKIRVIAEVEYEVEVEASSENKAIDEAIARDQENLPSDFNVNKGYIKDWDAEEIEQLTFVCQRCDHEFPMAGAVKQWKEDDEFCAPCGKLIEAEDKERDARIQAQALRRKAEQLKAELASVESRIRTQPAGKASAIDAALHHAGGK